MAQSKKISKSQKTNKYSITQMSSSNEIKQIMLDEGFRSKVYKDTKGLKTIGYGFNLDAKSNKKILNRYLGGKYNFDKLKNGTEEISMADAEILLRGIVNNTQKDLKKEFGKSWNNFNGETKNILTNMTYQLGISRFKKFKKMIKALKKDDYKTGAKEMLDSKWARSDSPNRAKRLAKRMIKANNVK